MATIIKSYDFNSEMSTSIFRNVTLQHKLPDTIRVCRLFFVLTIIVVEGNGQTWDSQYNFFYSNQFSYSNQFFYTTKIFLLHGQS